MQSPIVAPFGPRRSTVVKPPFSAASLALTAASISAWAASAGNTLEVTNDVKPTDWEHLSAECKSNEVADDAKPSDWERAFDMPASSTDWERCGECKCNEVANDAKPTDWELC